MTNFVTPTSPASGILARGVSVTPQMSPQKIKFFCIWIRGPDGLEPWKIREHDTVPTRWDQMENYATAKSLKNLQRFVSYFVPFCIEIGCEDIKMYSQISHPGYEKS